MDQLLDGIMDGLVRLDWPPDSQLEAGKSGNRQRVVHMRLRYKTQHPWTVLPAVIHILRASS